MKLWNDYEGKLLAERYTLGSLLRPEGRSALFTFTAGPGSPALIRITESLNDEGEMLSTWRRLAELKHENLLSITDFGETICESTPLTYAVLEPTDADLEDLLSNRPLTQPEAVQVATSLAAALSALHSADLMHEHIEPNNLFAVGETVKLRADSVRRVIVDNEFVTVDDRVRMVKQDVHDLGILLLRALTREKKLRPGLSLPSPFNQIIPRAIEGAWGLPEISNLLAHAAASVAPADAQASPSPAVHPVAAPVPGPAVAAVVPAAPDTSRITVAAAETSPALQPTLPYVESAPQSSVEPHTVIADNPLLYQRRVQVPGLSVGSRIPRGAPLAIAAAVVLAVLLFVLRGSSAAKSQAVAVSPRAAQPVPETKAARLPLPAETAPERTASAPAGPAAFSARLEPGWYVIAYTFNHEEQALKRASAIVRRYPGLHPQVIAPAGNSYLVALGGAMSRNEAESILSHARRAGMPRDTFVRNYGS